MGQEEGVGNGAPRCISQGFSCVKVAEKFCWTKGIVSAASLLYVLSYPGLKGILYINPSDLGWNPPVSSWIDRREIQSERANLTILFDKYLPICLDTLRTRYHLKSDCTSAGKGRGTLAAFQTSCAVLGLCCMWHGWLVSSSPLRVLSIIGLSSYKQQGEVGELTLMLILCWSDLVFVGF